MAGEAAADKVRTKIVLTTGYEVTVPGSPSDVYDQLKNAQDGLALLRINDEGGVRVFERPVGRGDRPLSHECQSIRGPDSYGPRQEPMGDRLGRGIEC